MSSLPDLPPEIWLEVMQFATYVHRQNNITPLAPFAQRSLSHNAMALNSPTTSMRTKLNLQRVCRSWRILALRITYQYLDILSPSQAEKLLAVLERSSQGPVEQRLYLGQWTRHIEIYTHARGAGGLLYLKTLFRILQACPNLRMLSGHWNHHLPPEFLDAISRMFGSSLQGLYWDDYTAAVWPKTTIVTPHFLGSFVALHVLDLRSYGGKSDIPTATITLPKVRDLILSNAIPGIAVATILGLPALQNLTLKTHPKIHDPRDEFLFKFLEAHGASLISVDIHSPSLESETSSTYRRVTSSFRPDIFLRGNLCPNLVTLVFPISSPRLDLDTPHPLRRIGLRGVCADTMYPNKNLSTKLHLMSLNPDRYPRLEVVKTVGFLAEAVTDDLIKDIFVWWVQKFEKQGVDFLDGEGVLWTYTNSMSDVEE